MRDKIIEEMAKYTCRSKNSCYTGDCIGSEICAVRENCEKLYNAGYRKIPENAVVLTKEEWDKYQETQRDWNAIYFDGIDKTRKETAEKFAEKSKQRLSDKLHRGKALHATAFGKEYVRRIFKEVVDEICKEIIGE